MDTMMKQIPSTIDIAKFGEDCHIHIDNGLQLSQRKVDIQKSGCGMRLVMEGILNEGSQNEDFWI